MRTTILIQKHPWGYLKPVGGTSFDGYFCSMGLNDDSVLFGRDNECNKVFPHEFVVTSGKHMRIYRQDNVAILEDISRNGTILNGDLIKKEKRELRHGDSIEIGISTKECFQMLFFYRFFGVEEKYIFHEMIGRGCFGIVYRGSSKSTGKPVAIKMFRKCDYVAVKKEIRILESINHPHIVQLYDYALVDDALSIICELCSYGDLHTYVENVGFLSECVCAHMCAQLADALAYLHGINLAHRDVKLENVMICDNSPFPCVKLADFGLARFIEREYAALTACGTTQYAAPEVIELAKKYMAAENVQKESNEFSEDKQQALVSPGVVTPGLTDGLGNSIPSALSSSAGLTPLGHVEQSAAGKRGQKEQNMELEAECAPHKRDFCRGYGVECDMWSFGVLIVKMLKGISHSLELPQDLQAERWSETTTPFLPLLRGLLQQSPHARITAREVVESEWLAQWKNGKRALDGEENGESAKRVKMDDELNFITNKVGLF